VEIHIPPLAQIPARVLSRKSECTQTQRDMKGFVRVFCFGPRSKFLFVRIFLLENFSLARLVRRRGGGGDRCPYTERESGTNAPSNPPRHWLFLHPFFLLGVLRVCESESAQPFRPGSPLFLISYLPRWVLESLSDRPAISCSRRTRHGPHKAI
jgi:hypothetical protein